MTVAILIDDILTGEILAALLHRIDIEAIALRPPRPGRSQRTPDEHLEALRPHFADIVWVDGPPSKAVRALAIEPSLAAWLTRDVTANQHVLGKNTVPAPEEADTWLRSLRLGRSGSDRRYSATIDGHALATRMDLGLLAAFSPAFRELITSLRPAWATIRPIKRGRGRPPGVALFRGTGYAMCLELLHVGSGAQVTPAAMIEVLGRTKTPVLRLLNECQRRGYVRRTSARGPLTIRNTARLVDDLVADTRARRIHTPPTILGISTDRDPANLMTRLSQRLGERGRILAVTGSSALLDSGGDSLIDGVTVAYANLDGIDAMLGDAYPDSRRPRLVLVEPTEEAVLHRIRAGTPAMVSPWQATIDMLTSENEREREVGAEVRRRLEDRHAT
jgi:hypothetical protein